jgi:hypothetical protein
MGETSTVIFQLYPFNRINEIENIKNFHGQHGADEQLKLR